MKNYLSPQVFIENDADLGTRHQSICQYLQKYNTLINWCQPEK